MEEKDYNKITTEDIFYYLQDHMVVKEDFENFKESVDRRLTYVETNMATKDDVVTLSGRVDRFETNMATKDDLKNFATKDDLAAMETRMVSKSYLDDKLSDLGAEIGMRINRRAEREQEFKRTLIHILKSHSLVGVDELNQLEGLV